MMLTELIDELEKAGEGSRELDSAVAEYFGVTHCAGGGWPFAAGSLLDKETPHYTTSIDAKLPGEDGLFWVIERWPDMGWRAQALDESCKMVGEAYSKTEPLARRIAALKARETAQ